MASRDEYHDITEITNCPISHHTYCIFPLGKKKKRYIFKKKATFGTEVGGDSAIRIESISFTTEYIGHTYRTIF